MYKQPISLDTLVSRSEGTRRRKIGSIPICRVSDNGCTTLNALRGDGEGEESRARSNRSRSRRKKNDDSKKRIQNRKKVDQTTTRDIGTEYWNYLMRRSGEIEKGKKKDAVSFAISSPFASEELDRATQEILQGVGQNVPSPSTAPVWRRIYSKGKAVRKFKGVARGLVHLKSARDLALMMRGPASSS